MKTDDLIAGAAPLVRVPFDTRVINQDPHLLDAAYRLRYHRREQDETADADALEEELKEASEYVSSILPRPIETGPVMANWFHLPSTRVGGDAFGYQMLDRRYFALFLLDVLQLLPGNEDEHRPVTLDLVTGSVGVVRAASAKTKENVEVRLPRSPVKSRPMRIAR